MDCPWLDELEPKRNLREKLALHCVRLWSGECFWLPLGTSGGKLQTWQLQFKEDFFFCCWLQKVGNRAYKKKEIKPVKKKIYEWGSERSGQGRKQKAKRSNRSMKKKLTSNKCKRRFWILWCGQIVGARELVPKTSACWATQLFNNSTSTFITTTANLKHHDVYPNVNNEPVPH